MIGESAKSKYISYKFNLVNEEKESQEGQQDQTTKIEPILGHCSNLLKIEVDKKFIYTGEQGKPLF